MISESRIYKVIVAPITTEKSTNSVNNQHTVVFKVALNATKDEIKAAAAQLFGTDKVLNVRTLVMKGKTRRTVHGIGRRSDWKKAYITLPDDVNISDTSALEQTADKESK